MIYTCYRNIDMKVAILDIMNVAKEMNESQILTCNGYDLKITPINTYESLLNEWNIYIESKR